MKLVDRLLGNKVTFNTSQNSQVVERDGVNWSFSADIESSDIVKACIKPKVKAIGKLQVKHVIGDIEQGSELIDLLNEPNEIDSLQTLLEKLVTQLQLNNNGYAIIERDNKGKPVAIIPVLSNSAEMSKSKSGNFFITFKMSQKEITVPYADVIHLKQEHNAKEYFGQSPAHSIQNILKSISASDESVEHAIKNSTKLRWLMKFNNVIRPEDMRQQIEQFRQDYLQIENEGGIAGTDNKYDLEQIKQQVYVPDTAIQKEKIERLYSYFGVNESIVKNNYTEDEWSAFYEAEIEPLIIALQNEFTRKLFTKVERRKGNRIIFDGTGFLFSSMETKLKLVDYVDRGLVTPNEARKIMNMPSIEGGDIPIRRLDTARVDDERFYNVVDDTTLKGGDKDEV
ncbi:phage portal protein [Savagea sp. SN6]|uniref:Phage portal protein n=1 Tax=Savagea serpentis TaxID=2785297 RepID=A0A8J7GJY8_9BACL|nr:phage portal protein [Savagea serpentis]MBF4500228.1 phage portal protein [Savagea serpentis]